MVVDALPVFLVSLVWAHALAAVGQRSAVGARGALALGRVRAVGAQAVVAALAERLARRANAPIAANPLGATRAGALLMPAGCTSAGRYCDWAAPVPLESEPLLAARVPAVPATIAPTVRRPTSQREMGAERREADEGLLRAMTVVLMRSSSNPLSRDFSSRSRRTTSSSSAPQCSSRRLINAPKLVALSRAYTNERGVFRQSTLVS